MFSLQILLFVADAVEVHPITGAQAGAVY